MHDMREAQKRGAPRGFEEMIEHYESIAMITQRMREAARHEDWDSLMSMQNEYIRLVDKLKPTDALSSRSPILPPLNSSCSAES